MVIFDINNPGEESDIVLCKQAIYWMGDPEDLMSFSKFKISVPDLRDQILSISCSFWENLVKSGNRMLASPPPGGLTAPQGNPGSVTEFVHSFCHAE